MNLNKVATGGKVPEEFNTIIEIQAGVPPVKYEIDKDCGMLVVNRYVATSMVYPCHYGFIPNTLAEDGDPIDTLVIATFPIHPGSVIKVRPIGALDMTDESGKDIKIICVPVNKVTEYYDNINTYTDLPQSLLKQISHFFEKYKDLEEGKWVKVEGYVSKEDAMVAIKKGIDNYGN